MPFLFYLEKNEVSKTYTFWTEVQLFSLLSIKHSQSAIPLVCCQLEHWIADSVFKVWSLIDLYVSFILFCGLQLSHNSGKLFGRCVRRES